MRNARKESSWEVRQTRELRGSSDLLSAFWNERYETTYRELLENIAETGRHGVIAEYLQHLLPQGTILDVGCGTGILTLLLDEQRYRYVGIDISEVAISFARNRRKRPRTQFVLARVEEFTPAEEFGAIVLNEVLYYTDAEDTLLRVSGWLKEPRLALVSSFDFKEGKEILERIRRSVEVVGETIVANPAEDLEWTVLALRL